MQYFSFLNCLFYLHSQADKHNDVYTKVRINTYFMNTKRSVSNSSCSWSDEAKTKRINTVCVCVCFVGLFLFILSFLSSSDEGLLSCWLSTFPALCIATLATIIMSHIKHIIHYSFKTKELHINNFSVQWLWDEKFTDDYSHCLASCLNKRKILICNQ